MFNIQPFGNVLVRLEIKGRDLYDIIDAQISPSYGPDYSISGFTYTWDPKTNKTADIFLEDGTPIDVDRTYTLTVNNFMASASGSKYLPISRLGKNPVTGPEDIEATVEFVKSFKEPIAYAAEGRIKKLAEDDSRPGEEPGRGADPDDEEKPGSGGADPNDEEKPAGDKGDGEKPGNDSGEKSVHGNTGDTSKSGAVPVAGVTIGEGADAPEEKMDGLSNDAFLSDSREEHKLPDTAASYGGFLLYGFLTFMFGAILYMRKRGIAKL